MKKLPTYKESRNIKGKIGKSIDYYVIYKNPNNYLNQWFEGLKEKTNQYLIDEIVTVKNVDEKTSKHLYDKNINPIILRISDYTNYKEVYNNVIYMTANIFSIDDSCYNISFYEKLDELFEIRNKLVEYLSNLDLINGEMFLEKCIELGGNKNTITYS